MSRYRNTTNQPLVFDTAGHQVDGFGVVEVDAHDLRSARHIRARRLVLVPEPVEFVEPVVSEPEPEPETEPELVEEPESEPNTKSRRARNRSNKKQEDEQ